MIAEYSLRSSNNGRAGGDIATLKRKQKVEESRRAFDFQMEDEDDLRLLF